jgi:hypothetical protein
LSARREAFRGVVCPEGGSRREPRTSKGLAGRLAALLCATLAVPGALLAQPPDEGDDGGVAFSVALNQDNFFGFYPLVAGSAPINKTLDWTVYGIFWTTPSFGTGGGSGLWTEVGGGVNVTLLDGKLALNPQIGFLNGRLLSNGDFPMMFEGFVPNLTANLDTERAEGQLYAGFYTALRKGQTANVTSDGLVAVGVQNNFTHWWINGGAKLTPRASAGLHYEVLDFRPSGSGAAAVSSTGLYKWLGPYAQANLSDKFSARFTFGANVLDRPPTDGNDTFYKLTATYSF